MKITDDKINQLAHLARLNFSDSAKENIKTDLENILNLCQKLEEINTDGVEPLIHMCNTTNVVRKDLVKQEFSKELLLKNAPNKDSDYFRVPKVIEQNK